MNDAWRFIQLAGRGDVPEHAKEEVQMDKPPPYTPPKDRPSLIEQMDPDYGYDENGMSLGMTKADVQASYKRSILDGERVRLLHYWVPSSLAN